MDRERERERGEGEGRGDRIILEYPGENLQSERGVRRTGIIRSTCRGAVAEFGPPSRFSGTIGS